MKITSAEFTRSAFKKDHWHDASLPEIAFLGRSNVGKSSLLNALLQRKGLARTSNTPGRTQSINFFLVNESFYFADLPGYGFARVSKKIRAGWGNMAEEYLADRETLALSIQLVDSRHTPTELDIQLHEWLLYNSKEHIVVATKSDKLSSNQLQKSLNVIGKTLPGSRILPVSSETGKGKDILWNDIESSLRNFTHIG